MFKPLITVFVATSVLTAPLAMGPAGAQTLPRSHIVIPRAKFVDAAAQTAVLPLFKGTAAGKTVWYIVTDSSEVNDAKKRGVVYSPLIADLGKSCAACVQAVKVQGTSLTFAGAPDFSPARTFKAGPTGFPPAGAAPGATASAAYSPFIRIAGTKPVLNAPIVATGDGPFDVKTHANTHDRVLAIDTKAATVTLLLARGFANGKAVLYISTEASDPGVAAIERATYVPSLGKATSGKITIYAFANGQTGEGNRNAQGLAHAALDGHLNEDASAENAATLQSPLNVLGYFPSTSSASGFSPLWDANVLVWSKDTIAAGHNTRQTSAGAIAERAGANELSAPDGKPLHPIGVVVNCPVIAYIDTAP